MRSNRRLVLPVVLVGLNLVDTHSSLTGPAGRTSFLLSSGLGGHSRAGEAHRGWSAGPISGPGCAGRSRLLSGEFRAQHHRPAWTVPVRGVGATTRPEPSTGSSSRRSARKTHPVHVVGYRRGVQQHDSAHGLTSILVMTNRATLTSSASETSMPDSLADAHTLSINGDRVAPDAAEPPDSAPTRASYRA